MDHTYALPASPTQVCDVSSTTPSSESDTHECPVCLQAPQLPIKLPCNHIFCFLCAKGFANQHGRCAYCRAEIPIGYMQLPTVVPRNSEGGSDADRKYQWFYAGRNGWWQFENRHCEELEEALQKGDSQYELQVSGFMYVIDLHQMVQYRKDRPGRTRRIKRDIISAPRKGVAGLRDDLINGSLI
ncbi:E3 ubiquitin-protein ligase RNF146-A [Galendromus occidentalis]|uniref:E3 ubiquitin-protein ligase n=1 Tax=Galendromus occidentalis TaxID=34638 RepID=A0AAJ7L4J6_9ACAR|nr:E3 ubiquitin-protein ligase RNF146-A [Galendromus occidentalis]